ncbi:reverse transcriptase domain-containing protein, partial [Tanacetum coccineum]
MVPATAPLIGFNGEIIWPLRQLSLLVKIRNEEHSTSTWMNFVVVRSSSPYNGIIRRPGVRKIQAVPSTAHGMLKFPVAGGVLTLRSSKIIPTECEAVSGPEGQPSAAHQAREERIKVAINPDYLEQTIKIGSTLTQEGRNKLCDLLQRCPLVRQKRRSQAAERNQTIQEEDGKLVDVGIMKEGRRRDVPRLQGRTKVEWKAGKLEQLIAELPTLTAPKEKEELIVYLAVTKETVSAVLMTEWEAKQMPIYLVSRALRGPEVNYTSMEKLVLELVHASKRLKRYFQAHPIIVVTDQPIKQVNQKWHKVERPEEDDPDTAMEVEEELPEPWILFTDESSCADGSGAGLILINPEGAKFTYALRFRFEATNNEAEYEALIAGLRIAEKNGCKEPSGKCMRSVVAKALRTGYYWLTIHKDARALIRACQDCQVHKPIPRNLQQKLTPITSLWPFYKWGIVIAGPFLEGPANRLVERENQSLGEGIKARLDARSKNWMEEISHVLWTHRTMIKSSNADTPFSLTYGTEAVIPAEIGMPTLRTAEVDMVQNKEALGINLDLLEERREQASIREAKSKAKMEKYYNSKVRSTSFKPGGLMYRSNDVSRAEEMGNLCPKWEGPYK